MYSDFYNLREKPFNLTPSPRFLYLGEIHKEALALLTYGLVERKGFVLLTGEVGTGKTTMVQALLANVDKSVECVSISNPLFSTNDFMNYLASSAFQEEVSFSSKADFLIRFEGFLKECSQRQKHFLLIIDEAHKLSFALLEEIRLLSNLETADEKLMNIFLVGQPELNEKLNDPRCRALSQRISIRYHIEPLDSESTRDYIATRLKMAGAEDGHEIFPKDVVKAIHYYSEGYPRMINILADNALLLGYSKGQKKLTSFMIKECYEDLQLRGPSANSSVRGSESPEMRKAEESPQVRRRWRWAAALFVMMVIAAFAMSDYGSDMLSRLSVLIPARSQIASEEVTREKISLTERTDQKIRHGEDEGLSKIVIVKKGDTFSDLIEAIYGHVDDDIMGLVQEHNPDVEDINHIKMGQRIVFPALSRYRITI